MSTTTQYIGEKYVPRVADPVEWDVNREYEHLIIVMHDGDSYISKQDVPKGAQITNTRYWLKTNNFSAQLDQTIKKANSGIEKADEALGKFPVSIPNGGTGATTAANARSNLGLGNVENKSSATIRNELTKANVTSALGYTPSSSDNNTTYSLSQDSSDGHKLTLTGSDGTSKIITVPDNDTKALGSMTGTLDISHGGTGKTTAADAWIALGGGSIGKKSSLAASDIPNLSTDKLTSGTLPIGRGGTGKTTAADAWTALGGGSVGKKNSLAASDIPSIDASKIGSGTLGIARGGTGATTAADARINLGVTAANIVDNNAIKPSSVAATGTISSNTNIITGGALKPSSKSRSTSYVSGGKGGSALIYAEKETGKNFWYPAMTIQTNGGGSWQIGNYDNENLQFVYFDKSHLDANNNQGQLYLNITPYGIDMSYLSGILPINKGGTSATNTSDAFHNLTGYWPDFWTENSTDTWIPIYASGEKIQHRTVPVRLTTEATITFAMFSSVTSGSSARLSRRGGVVSMTFYGLYIHSGSGRATIGNVPSGWRPADLTFGLTGGAQKFGVESDGSIWVDEEMRTGAPQWGSATWAVG